MSVYLPFAFFTYIPASDTVWCVDSVPVGTTNYVMIFNGGESAATIDNIGVYRYACFVSIHSQLDDLPSELYYQC